MNRRGTWAAIVIVVLLGWGIRAAHAGMLIYMRVEGILGESTASNHLRWSDVQAVSGGVEQTSVGTEFSDLSVLKVVDSASPGLILSAAERRVIATVDIDFQREGSSIVFYSLHLSNVTVSAVKQNGVAESVVPTELVTFKFGKIQWSYIQINSKGDPSAPITGGWDVQANKKL